MSEEFKIEIVNPDKSFLSKDDVTEVKAGFECGIRLDSFNDYEEGDVIETFEVEKIRPSL